MRILAAAAASAALSLAVVAVLFGIASLAGDSARVWTKAWEQEGSVKEWQQWRTAFKRLHLAHRLSPLNADYSADLGRLMEWQAWQQNRESGAYEASRDLAEMFYRESISRRPSWGFVWAHYAENRFLRGNSDDEFRHALKKSIELAPWEPGVQRKVAWIGMAAWEELPADLQMRVSENIERSVKLDVHRYEIIRLAAHYGWLQHLIPMMRSQSQIAALELVLQQIERR